MGDTVIENIADLKVVDTSAKPVEDDDFVDPWNVESKSDAGVDYDKLISMLNQYKTNFVF